MQHPEVGTMSAMFNFVNRKHTPCSWEIETQQPSALFSDEFRAWGGRRLFPPALHLPLQKRRVSQTGSRCGRAWWLEQRRGRTDTSLDHTEEGECEFPIFGSFQLQNWSAYRSQPWAGCRGNRSSRSSSMRPQFFPRPERVSPTCAINREGRDGNTSASPKPKSWKEQRAHHSCIYSSNYKQPRACGGRAVGWRRAHPVTSGIWNAGNGDMSQDLWCLFVFIFGHCGHMSSLTGESGH